MYLRKRERERERERERMDTGGSKTGKRVQQTLPSHTHTAQPPKKKALSASTLNTLPTIEVVFHLFD